MISVLPVNNSNKATNQQITLKINQFLTNHTVGNNIELTITQTKQRMVVTSGYATAFTNYPYIHKLTCK